MDRTDLAWAAGYVDGDGCLRPGLVSVAGIDKLLVLRFRSVIGIGSVRGPFVQHSAVMNRSPQWECRVYGGEKVGRIVRSLWPWLTPSKREPLAPALKEPVERELRHIAEPGKREWVAWAAGFFDAEGCFSSPKSGMTARIGNTDRAALERFRYIVGFGSIYGPYPPSTNTFRSYKDLYVYAASGFEQVQALLAVLWFRLGRRKRDKAVSILSSYRPFHRCGHLRKPGPWKQNCPTCFKPGPKPGQLAGLRREFAASRPRGDSARITRVQATGHVYLPKAVRDSLELRPRQDLSIALSGCSVIVQRPSTSLRGGSLARLLARGMLVLPAEIRREGGINPKDLISISIDQGRILLTPVPKT